MTRSPARPAATPTIISKMDGARLHALGQVVAQGTLKQILKSKGSITADYLNGTREVPVPATRRKGNGKKLTVHNATANNLTGDTASIPLGTITCVTGVSGSGKSSLVGDVLEPALREKLGSEAARPGGREKLICVEVQSPHAIAGVAGWPA